MVVVVGGGGRRFGGGPAFICQPQSSIIKALHHFQGQDAKTPVDH